MRARRWLWIAGAAAGLLAVPVSFWLARGPASTDLYATLGAQIGCQCGTCPSRPIATCGCGFADRMLAEMAEMVNAGQNAEAVMAAFAARYGPAVRIVPEAAGLELMAWLAPLLLLLLGGVVVTALILRWQRPDRPDGDPDAGDPGATPTPPGTKPDRYRELVDRELRDFPE